MEDELETNYALVAASNIVFEAVRELDEYLEESLSANEEIIEVRDDLLAVCERIRLLQTF